jgi:hypothetical protein
LGSNATGSCTSAIFSKKQVRITNVSAEAMTAGVDGVATGIGTETAVAIARGRSGNGKLAPNGKSEPSARQRPRARKRK